MFSGLVSLATGKLLQFRVKGTLTYFTIRDKTVMKQAQNDNAHDRLTLFNNLQSRKSGDKQRYEKKI